VVTLGYYGANPEGAALTKLRPEAVRLFSESLGLEDKVLITGASGWFGKTAIALTKTTGVTYLATGSRPRVIDIDGNKEKVESHDLDLISAFQPTVVIDAAFLTRDKVAVIGAGKYIEINQVLMKISKEIASLESVRKYVGFSSGATVNLAGHSSFSLSDNPYAALKKSYEEQMMEVSNWSKASVVIPRVYSVTGAYVNKPQLFAFSDLILQARAGVIEVRAKNKVLRRYSPVEDVIALAVAQSKQQGQIIFDTGGEMLEVGDLANQIRMEICQDAIIHREINPHLLADDYQSDNVQWSNVLSLSDMEQAPLSEQIRRAARHLV